MENQQMNEILDNMYWLTISGNGDQIEDTNDMEEDCTNNIDNSK